MSATVECSYERGEAEVKTRLRLAALAEKYRTMAGLRRALHRGEPPPDKATLTALARAFPGALRELEVTRLSVLESRAAALEHAVEDPLARAPWMFWSEGFHRWLRAALWLKPRVAHHLRAEGPLSDALCARLAHEVTAAREIPADSRFVRAVSAPPGGRIIAVVVAQVAHEHAATEEHVRAWLFPPWHGIEDDDG